MKFSTHKQRIEQAARCRDLAEWKLVRELISLEKDRKDWKPFGDMFSRMFDVLDLRGYSFARYCHMKVLVEQYTDDLFVEMGIPAIRLYSTLSSKAQRLFRSGVAAWVKDHQGRRPKEGSCNRIGREVAPDEVPPPRVPWWQFELNRLRAELTELRAQVQDLKTWGQRVRAIAKASKCRRRLPPMPT